MTYSERETNRRILENLQENLQIWEGRLALWIGDPEELKPGTVLNYCQTLVQIEGASVLLCPKGQLRALNLMEAWYQEHGIDYPYPERLAEQKATWQRRIES